MPGPRDLIARLRRSPRLLGALAVAVVLVAAATLDVPGRLAGLAPTGTPTTGASSATPSSAPSTQAPRLVALTNADNRLLDRCTPGSDRLARCGPAPALGEGTWLNTPGGDTTSLDDLRGSVVLVDFFSGSCLSCRRAARYVTAWQRTYADAGLQVVGVHSPERAYEKDDRWLARALDDLAITFPVLQDQGYATLTDYRTQVLPSTYLVDVSGTVRAISLGEGGAERTERLLRQLLQDRDPDAPLPAPIGALDDGEDPEPGTTGQIDLADSRGTRVDSESDTVVGDDTRFRLPSTAQPDGTFSLGGLWTTGTEYLVPRDRAVARVSYRGRAAYQLVGGSGTLTVTTSSGMTRRIVVDGDPEPRQVHVAPFGPEILTVRYDGDLRVYAFSFG
ncbi:redoxin domain-containing protein [Aeromicrobium fastidiosum]|uniref:redoxin domain-containing protein n=1 Tax=Aeromicrobium fastidiosum TaxID=52699 RepID=UPI0020233382|nr:redoxin domain-containing protein [Aeromicrobium fastidiosum]MCL8253144.1 redoxin domain-containing protein [Aeromicrobium fastidiosum]